ncbi:MAG: glycosyltransferase, partial [Zoogloeaceae bacterium]|nr:glycosyltransferase [Zoogloeaceae bacterium]
YLENNPVYAGWYLEKLDHLRRADLLLSISASSGREAASHLDFPPEHIVNISGDCGAAFRPQAVTEECRRQLREDYGITRPFVMYTGGLDHRKNIGGLIRAYAALSPALREAHQLVVVCAAHAGEQRHLELLALQQGLARDEFIMTGFVPEAALVRLYNACKLFVFPSQHEGLGLPVLEAMRCGKAVIAGNNSSLPEVLGRDDALFDAGNPASIAAKMAAVLEDATLRQSLEAHGPLQAQKFSWEASACRALAALAARHATTLAARAAAAKPPARRPRLAYLSPLPPEASGISDYSAELLPVLSEFYAIEVIVAQAKVTDPWITEHCPVRSVEWFCAHAGEFERVLYHFGNSSFHLHQFALLEQIPGVIALHDFFLSGIQADRAALPATPYVWARSLYESHGYPAVLERYLEKNISDVIWRYPANLSVLQSALGVIVHSEHARALAGQWYGAQAGQDWHVVPHLREAASGAPSEQARERERAAARQALGLAPEDFLVCSFGFLGMAKQNERLLDAWRDSPLAADARARLVFVGDQRSDYGRWIERKIRMSGLEGQVCVTGRVDRATFRRYLAAADVGVQLRIQSRGETSGTALDCMNHGLATVVNAHGSQAELDANAVWMLPDAFENRELSQALLALRDDPKRRRALGEAGRVLVAERHAPRSCAQKYAEAIERAYARAQGDAPGLLPGLARTLAGAEALSPWAALLAVNFPPAPRARQLLVDVSELVVRDVKSGIQRVTRAVLREWLTNPAPNGWRVEPVYATPQSAGYFYARRFTCRFLGIPDAWTEDVPVDAWEGDVFFGLDLQPQVIPAQRACLEKWHHSGVRVGFLVHDLLPVTHSEFFPPGSANAYQPWLETIGAFDAAICVSRSTADELKNWLDSFGPRRTWPLCIEHSHNGADMAASAPSRGLPPDADAVLDVLSARPPGFLMVGTLEPRKGHAEVLDAFERLWAEGAALPLVIVGRQGWMVEALVQRLAAHPQKDRLLFWLPDVSDEYLERLYAAAACLIAASHAEGFGLPLIEAAQHGLPVIARDIPVFREIAGDHACYFRADLAATLAQWRGLYEAGEHPRTDALPWQTWRESAARLWQLATATTTVLTSGSQTTRVLPPADAIRRPSPPPKFLSWPLRRVAYLTTQSPWLLNRAIWLLGHFPGLREKIRQAMNR